ncbi:polyhydroxybutyrate depolymerase [Burkholderia thailandensis]|uniref:alpha/beta hydrolase family esterase n=3 Tax=Burkholderia thailandensis TaxID=57975 RepID=UPI002EDA66E4
MARARARAHRRGADCAAQRLNRPRSSIEMHPTTAALGTLASLLASVCAFALCRGRMRSPDRQPAPPARVESLRVGDTVRTFLHVTPPSLPPNAPLVIVFHGGSGTPEQIRKYTAFEFDALADVNGFALAYPRGVGGNWNTCQKGRRNAATRRNVDDVGFTREIIAWFASVYGIDRSRVFVVGFSNGGHMCFRLALEMANELAGFAAISANRPAPADCRHAGRRVAVPMMTISGTADPINPYRGGELSPYGLRTLGPVLSAEETARSFARPHAQHRRDEAGDLFPRDRQTRAVRDAWGDENVLITIHGGGHTIPQPRYTFPRLFGRTSTAVDAPLEIWHFFRMVAANRARAAAPKPRSLQSG